MDISSYDSTFGYDCRDSIIYADLCVKKILILFLFVLQEYEPSHQAIHCTLIWVVSIQMLVLLNIWEIALRKKFGFVSFDQSVELEKTSYCDLKVVNNTEHHVAFKVHFYEQTSISYAFCAYQITLPYLARLKQPLLRSILSDLTPMSLSPGMLASSKVVPARHALYFLINPLHLSASFTISVQLSWFHDYCFSY